MARMSSGVVRQQPPISLAPAARQRRAGALKSVTPLLPTQQLCSGSQASPLLG